MNKTISKDTTALYVDGWLAEFLFFDGENITFKKAHGTDIGKVFKIPLSDWSTDEYGLSYETKEYKDKKVEVNNISKVATGKYKGGFYDFMKENFGLDLTKTENITTNIPLTTTQIGETGNK